MCSTGVVIAIAATLVHLISKMMFPRDALLGRISGRDGLYKLHRFPEARPIPGLALYMIQGSLLFFNADYVRERIQTIATGLPAGTRWFVLDASAIAQIDSTAVAMLDDIRADLAAKRNDTGHCRVARRGKDDARTERCHRAHWSSIYFRGCGGCNTRLQCQAERTFHGTAAASTETQTRRRGRIM